MSDRPVGLPVIRELSGIRQALLMSSAMLVTTSGATAAAVEAAAAERVQIVDRDVLAKWISAYPSVAATRTTTAEFRSCFVSHSSQDRDFVDRLVKRLRQAGVKVWYAPDQLRPGEKIQEEVSKAIDTFDRLIVVLSESSIASRWVQSEIRRARKREMEEGARILFPISLTPIADLQSWELFDSDSAQDLAIEIREYYIPHFSNGLGEPEFEEGVARLLDGLSSSDSVRS